MPHGFRAVRLLDADQYAELRFEELLAHPRESLRRLCSFFELDLATVAIDAKTGKRLWMRIAPAKRLEKFHSAGSPAAATAASDGKRVFVFFGSYGLLCYDLDGKRLWSKPM